mgnify:CR=1 FL=1
MNNINTYAKLPSIFYHKNLPRVPSNPKLIAYNQQLAKELNLNLNDSEILKIFSGSKLPVGFEALSMNYCGHQFGHFNPQLGDGRAHLLTEVYGLDKKLYDIQLKGSGQSNYSRRGDGLSPIGPVVREYLVSEAMEKLGVPTTRALCAVSSGDKVYREHELPGGVLTRVSESLLRVGHFEYYISRGDITNLKLLADYSIDRLYPELKKDSSLYFEFFKTVARKKLDLVGKWMGLGFIHGVMNTDNTSIFGLTIDYGPCAFMDEFKQNKVFSSIDRNDRYAYNKQMEIALWNLSIFARTLFPLIENEMQLSESEVINLIESEFKELQSYSHRVYINSFAKKFGFKKSCDKFKILLDAFLTDMEENKRDFTNTFFQMRSLDYDNIKLKEDWLSLLKERDIEQSDAASTMSGVNPYIIPRNHQIELAIKEVERGELEKFNYILEAFSNPFLENPEFQKLTFSPEKSEKVYQTFCGT